MDNYEHRILEALKKREQLINSSKGTIDACKSAFKNHVEAATGNSPAFGEKGELTVKSLGEHEVELAYLAKGEQAELSVKTCIALCRSGVVVTIPPSSDRKGYYCKLTVCVSLKESPTDPSGEGSMAYHLVKRDDGRIELREDQGKDLSTIINECIDSAVHNAWISKALAPDPEA